MSNKKTFNLLSRITFFYLIFTLVVFLFNAKFLTREADEFIDSDLNRRFGWLEKKAKYLLEEGMSPDSIIGHNITKIKEVSKRCKKTEYPVNEDITVFHEDIERNLIHRKRISLIEANGKIYRIEMDREVQNYYYFRDDIFEYVVPSFIVLIILTVTFNYLLSGYFLQSFRRILEQMQRFKVGSADKIEKVETSTSEFVEMQNLFTNMVKRIDADYNHLKEYTEDIAHEIQTPLAIIRNKAETLMISEELEEKDARVIKTIYDEANHLSRLGTTLNLITKIENGEFTDIQEIKTEAEINKQVEAIEELASLKSLSIEKNLLFTHTLTIDPYLFDIILKNLLKNAIRYGSNEGPIKIKTTEVSFSISNYGAPLTIPEDQLFKRFIKGNSSSQSLGLGLALVHKICKVSGLTISYKYEHRQHIFTVEA
ncbi:sensor histidine kinase [Flammeovirga kamogawensis]|uniref:histidine kinase n=1 Tax=Flammeovirga kamogawensis TaxID=373891 RepID=A0ABX8H089_9BACT|nr:HAMP domain-containing sensor histidine kinase [Flammeovirga kamogawensis]MBB6459344.1 signal transduction histidine kinase [Flammeovirga kamogawensis]QWG08901.1 HAMP domain-containing histidine kinase [Flammeovirga kamogawensis]TRX67192.1 HAMP domain-containing histidine kinase [Flammeovirga kamogawensis]